MKPSKHIMFRYLGVVTEVSSALCALCYLGLSWAVLSQSAGVFDLRMRNRTVLLMRMRCKQQKQVLAASVEADFQQLYRLGSLLWWLRSETPATGVYGRVLTSTTTGFAASCAVQEPAKRSRIEFDALIRWILASQCHPAKILVPSTTERCPFTLGLIFTLLMMSLLFLEPF
jgi:hypothetical protein